MSGGFARASRLMSSDPALRGHLISLAVLFAFVEPWLALSLP